MKRWVLAFAGCCVATTAHAAPTGRWWAGFGQGTHEYAIKNDSAGSDYFYIACPEDRGAKIMITVGGKNPRPGSLAVVTIGSEEIELPIDGDGHFNTSSHLAYDNFRTLWPLMRQGSAMRVRLSTGESTAFTLRGVSKVLPRDHCETGYEK